MDVARQTFPAHIRPIARKATPEEELPREPDGCISDEQVARDREQLRRQQAEESEVVLQSSNGHHDDWGNALYKSLTDIAVHVKEYDC